ncbi:MAG: hypothetical protein WC371_00305 [Parachlamydiales bacterium]|jgi:hypothetical protein
MEKQISLEPKAFYNLLKYNFLKNPRLSVEAWQVEDLRPLALEKLFEKLKAMGLDLDKARFLELAENYEAPEDLAAEEFQRFGEEQTEKIYLICFELWRRLLPEKAGLSLFCDEMDHLIHLYSLGAMDSDENLQDALAALLDILEKQVDQGAVPKELFHSLSGHFGHNLELFLYDYVFDQIEASNELYAEELIEGFYPFVTIERWFDFLRVKIAIKKDAAEANSILKNLIRELKESPVLDLQMEILLFMVEEGDPELFLHLAKQTLALVRNETDLTELMEIALDYYRRLDLEKKEQLVQALLARSKAGGITEEIGKGDQRLGAFENILSG